MFLEGYKTYIVGGLATVIGVLEILSPGVTATGADPMNMLTIGLSAMGLRRGMARK